MALLEWWGCLSNPLFTSLVDSSSEFLESSLILEACWGGWQLIVSGHMKGPLQGEWQLQWEVTWFFKEAWCLRLKELSEDISDKKDKKDGSVTPCHVSPLCAKFSSRRTIKNLLIFSLSSENFLSLCQQDEWWWWSLTLLIWVSISFSWTLSASSGWCIHSLSVLYWLDLKDLLDWVSAEIMLAKDFMSGMSSTSLSPTGSDQFWTALNSSDQHWTELSSSDQSFRFQWNSLI